MAEKVIENERIQNNKEFFAYIIYMYNVFCTELTLSF